MSGEEADGRVPDGEHDDTDEHDPADDWDRDDPRRQHDKMAPPAEPCECWCLHCGRTFMSDQIWFQKVIGDPQGFDGFWMCPTPNCSGAGFTFDIFPTDPAHPANAGWYDDDEDDEDQSGEWDADDPSGGDEDWDADEAKYKAFDAFDDEDDDDLEGEEWKYGLQPGERPALIDEAVRRAEAEREEEERSYNEPDRRPRELDWSDREDRHEGPSRDEDIPF